MKNLWGTYKNNLLIFGIYFSLALTFMWPLPLSFFNKNPFDRATDNMFIQWIMAWDWHAITHYPWRFFEANMYWPAHHTLAWGDHEFGLMLLIFPFLALNSATAAYNALYLLAPLLSAFCLFLLVKEITNNKWAAFWAGLSWGFIGLRFATHPQIFVTQWIPLLLYFFEKFRKNPNKKYLWGIGILSSLALSIGIYLSVFTVFTVIIYLFGLLVGKLVKLKNLIWPLVAAVIGGILAAPLYIPSFVLNLRRPTDWPIGEVVRNSLTLSDAVPKLPTGQPSRELFGKILPNPQYSYMYLGLAVFVALIVSVLIMIGKIGKVTKEQKILMITFCALALASFVLMFGPRIRINSQTLNGIRNPLHYLMYFVFPGFKILRDPVRWFWTFFMGLVIVASFGMAWFFDLLKKTWIKILICLVLVVMVIVEQKPLNQPTKFYSFQDSQTAQWLVNNASEQPILELPVGTNPWDPNVQIMEGRRMFDSTYHWAKRGTGATSPYVSPEYLARAVIYSQITDNPQSLNSIKQNGFRFVVVYPQDFSQLGLSQDQYQKTIDVIQSQPDVKKVAEFLDGIVFEIIR